MSRVASGELVQRDRERNDVLVGGAENVSSEIEMGTCLGAELRDYGGWERHLEPSKECIHGGKARNMSICLRVQEGNVSRKAGRKHGSGTCVQGGQK